jgi:hypothetical protein
LIKHARVFLQNAWNAYKLAELAYAEALAAEARGDYASAAEWRLHRAFLLSAAWGNIKVAIMMIFFGAKLIWEGLLRGLFEEDLSEWGVVSLP